MGRRRRTRRSPLDPCGVCALVNRAFYGGASTDAAMVATLLRVPQNLFDKFGHMEENETVLG
ncbi:hypothetical protein Sinac_5326 [Singulisphaera acidiphila DSM 18658]|uniref:Uncharacterized protein n=1 Tax=Singulisphaera acidiphila (strain ATCC BAA-1392 / DSM 18658 / VKM B-2454 / MOB10) TaxID=886293 RepID=L0DLE5_SINAD|nr:hypothetical protein Sinac_5326 [Singulisphaera acidiphila DSM 18658]